MANETLIKKVLSISPIIEVLIRVIYYSNISFLKKYAYIYRTNPYHKLSKKTKKIKKNKKINIINIKKIFKFLEDNHIKKGDLIIVHSSFKNIQESGLNPNQVIDLLLELIGEEGTLAMSARPNFDLDLDNFMTSQQDESIYFYDPDITQSNTGILAKELLKRNGSIRSEHPVNSLVAIGPLAKKIMKNNLIDNDSLPHGVNSSWHNCILNKAKILAIGVDLVQSSTITKTVEDVFSNNWPVNNWYVKKNYIIKSNKVEKKYCLRERAHKWSLHYAERTMCKDFIKKNILFCYKFDGLSVEIAKSNDMFNFLSKKRNKAYPYFFTYLNLLKFVKK